MAKKTAAEVFSEEFICANKAKEVIENQDNFSKDQIIEEFKKLHGSFEQLMGDATMITSISDRLQNKLNSANELMKMQAEEISKQNSELDTKNKALTETIEELTKARVGRQAATITLVLFVVLFITEEILIGPQIDNLTNNNQVYSALIKGAIALLLKPLEGFVESQLLKAVQRAEKKKRLEELAMEEKLKQEQAA
jgi:hypothetical protein